jgi:hypothetical protein
MATDGNAAGGPPCSKSLGKGVPAPASAARSAGQALRPVLRIGPAPVYDIERRPARTGMRMPRADRPQPDRTRVEPHR